METKNVITRLFADGHSVKRVDGTVYAVADTPEIAVRIVRDRNCHDELLAALRIIAEKIEREYGSRHELATTHNPIGEIYRDVFAAIAHATGEK